MKYYGKEKCRILKEIRAQIARENDIEWVVAECKHKGNCKGTCPKCEGEVRELEEALARREAAGKKVALVGVSAAVSLAVTGCFSPIFSSTAGVDMPLQGEPLPPAGGMTAEDTQTATPIPGEMAVTETESGEIVIDGLMGDPLPDTETAAETEEWDMGDETDRLMGEPMPDETEEAVTLDVVVPMGDMVLPEGLPEGE